MSASLPRFAVLGFMWYEESHMDVIVRRWFETFPKDADWGWTGPRSQIASLFVEQVNEKGIRPDISREFAGQHGVPMYDSVSDSLCLGGDTLAVDGVIFIGEHGNFPENELGQKLYPRKEMFDKIVEVFRRSGRCVPVFSDKHFSYDPVRARAMFDTAQQMGFSLTGGSSIPGALAKEEGTRNPAAPLREMVSVFYGGREVYGFHALEFVQPLVDRRPGAERGIRSITAYPREQFDDGLKKNLWSHELMDKARLVSHRSEPGDWLENVRKSKQGGDVFIVEYLDGLKVTHINLDGAIRGWSCAATEASGNTWARGARLGGKDLFFVHFARLSAQIERELITGLPSYPPKRLLLTTLATEAMTRAFAQPGVPVQTPGLAIEYHANSSIA